MAAREVIEADALAWMRDHPAPPASSVITSLPDVSELPHLGLDGWRTWFVDAARTVLRWVPRSGACVFFQSDVRHRGTWVDKGYLITRALEEERAFLVWHKIVCRRPPGHVSAGRPGYSRMMAVTRDPALRVRHPGPDVLPHAGYAPWSRGMGVEACRVACQFLLDETETRVVVDPFCGRGTVLAVATAMGLDAIGVEISARRCRFARSLVVPM